MPYKVDHNVILEFRCRCIIMSCIIQDVGMAEDVADKGICKFAFTRAAGGRVPTRRRQQLVSDVRRQQ